MNKLLVILTLLLTIQTFGQQKGNREKIKSLKVAFITDRLDLSAKEAQTFWPVYNDYEEKREALRQKERTEMRNKMRNAADLSDEEAENLFQQFMTFKEKEEKLNTAYLNEMKKVLSAKKTLLLLSSEEDFKRQLLRQYRQNRGGR